MPTHCAPCPGNTNTGFAPAVARPSTTTGDGSPTDSAASPDSNCSRSAAATTPRCSRWARVVAAEKPRSTRDSSGRASTCARSRPAWARIAATVRPDTVTATAGIGRAPGLSAGSPTGASSRMMWALVPLTPNDDTAARRGRPSTDHSRASVNSRTSPESQSMCGDGSSTCRVGGSTPCRIAITILITPATPAAREVCPMFDLIDPSHNGSPSRSRPYVASRAWASIGSPRTVPVPCPSTASTSAGRSPALASACRITRSWEGPLGAVSPLLAPSWLTAVPRMSPRIRRPLRLASDSRSSTTRPRPSEKPVPLAEAA